MKIDTTRRRLLAATIPTMAVVVVPAVAATLGELPAADAELLELGRKLAPLA